MGDVCVVCDVCCVVLCCVALCCVESCCAVLCVWCLVFCVSSFLPSFAPAVCYSKRGPNIKEYWEKQEPNAEDFENNYTLGGSETLQGAPPAWGALLLL